MRYAQGGGDWSGIKELWMADEPTHDDFFGAARDWKRSISHRASPRPYSDVVAFGPQCCDNHTTPPGYAQPR